MFLFPAKRFTLREKMGLNTQIKRLAGKEQSVSSTHLSASHITDTLHRNPNNVFITRLIVSNPPLKSKVKIYFRGQTSMHGWLLLLGRGRVVMNFLSSRRSSKIFRLPCISMTVCGFSFDCWLCILVWHGLTNSNMVFSVFREL